MYPDFLTFSQSASFLFLFSMFLLSSLHLYIYIYISFPFNFFATQRIACLTLLLENLAAIVLGAFFCCFYYQPYVLFQYLSHHDVCMMLKQYLVKWKFCLLKILINRFFTVFLENQFPIRFIKICKNCTNLFR